MPAATFRATCHRRRRGYPACAHYFLGAAGAEALRDHMLTVHPEIVDTDLLDFKAPTP